MNEQMRRRTVLLAALALALWVIGPVAAQESGLMGIRLGGRPEDLLNSPQYGVPRILAMPGASGQPVYNVLTGTGFPPFGLVAGQPAPAFAMRVPSLPPNSQQWIYPVGSSLYVGVIIRGQERNAVITDIMVFSAEKGDAGKAKTHLGIGLGSSFAQVLGAYDYPPVIEAFGGGASGPAPGAPAAAASTAVVGWDPNYTGEDNPSPPPAPVAPASPVAAAAPVAPTGGGTFVVHGRPVTFTRNMILTYRGVAFALFDMKVVRVHVSE